MPSVTIKLKVPATQRHHPEHAARARWFAISEVRFLYGLPKYINALVGSTHGFIHPTAPPILFVHYSYGLIHASLYNLTSYPINLILFGCREDGSSKLI
jgi:hypothetical protein